MYKTQRVSVNSFTKSEAALRAPIGQKIRNRRKSLGISQIGLARNSGISASYLNLIEANKRDVGGTLLQKIAVQLGVELAELSGDSEHRLISELEESFAEPVMQGQDLTAGDARALVTQFPQIAQAMAQLHRAYGEANAGMEAYANRLRADPLLSQHLHRVLSHITAVRSSSEILTDTPDLADADQMRFLRVIQRETQDMSDVAETLINHFDQTAPSRRASSPTRELDDFLHEENNHFPALESIATDLRREIAPDNVLTEASLIDRLEQEFSIAVKRGTPTKNASYRNQYHFDSLGKTIWFHGSTMASTRLFQLARLYGELGAPDALNAQIDDPRLSSSDARRLAFRAMASYLAGAILFPYAQFLDDAERLYYDIDHLGQAYFASFEQIAHRLLTLRRPGAEGIALAFLRSDPAGRLTKHFPLPGLMLPNSGHACPLWAIYGAFQTPGQIVRQVVRFADGGRYLFIAKTVSKRVATFRERPFHSSVMLATDILNADRTIYGQGLDLANTQSDILVGPSCRLCTRRECAFRQEEALDLAEGSARVHAPLVPRRFDLGGAK